MDVALASGNPAVETENIAIEGNLETSHLLEQVSLTPILCMGN